MDQANEERLQQAFNQQHSLADLLQAERSNLDTVDNFPYSCEEDTLDTIEIETYKGYTIRIQPDDDPMNPREDDNLGTMVFFTHSRSVGDDHDYNYRDFESWDEIEDQLRKDGAVICLPVYGYNHGSWSISTKVEPTWWHYAWDGGRLGFVAAFRADIEKIMGWKRIDSGRKLEIIRQLMGEVETYNAYLTGSYVGYTIEDQAGETVGGCWGFDSLDYALEQAKSEIDYLPVYKKVEA